jgi:hypothetical protein
MNASESEIDEEVALELILHAPEGAFGVRRLPLEGEEAPDCLEPGRPRRSPPEYEEGAVPEEDDE